MTSRTIHLISTLAAINTVPLPGEDALSWIFKAVLGLMVAIIAYFLKQIAQQIKTSADTLGDHERILRRHSLMFTYLVAKAKEEIEAREGSAGRRKSDQALLALLQALEVEESDE